jgi:hypothetical protein
MFTRIIFFGFIIKRIFFMPAYRFINPGLFFLNEAVEFVITRKIWGGNNDFRFIADLQRNGFSSFSASIDCVGYVHEKLIAFWGRLKNAHLLCCAANPTAQCMFIYASRFGFLRASHLNIFEQPPNRGATVPPP